MDEQKKTVMRHVTVCIDAKTLEKVRAMADEGGRSLSGQIAWMVKRTLKACEKDRG